MMDSPLARPLHRPSAECIRWLAGCVDADPELFCREIDESGRRLVAVYGPVDVNGISEAAADADVDVYHGGAVEGSPRHRPAALLSGPPGALEALADNLRRGGHELAGPLERALHPRKPGHWNIAGGRSLPLDRPLVMGVLNVTPDSFYSGSRADAVDEAVRLALRMASDGADIIDIGGESTRPGAEEVPEAEELERVAPVVEALAGETDLPLSVDTYKAAVAEAAVRAGAAIINDVGAGLRDEGMLDSVARTGAGYVMMHMRGDPRTMQKDTAYDDLLGEVHLFFADRLERCAAAGIGPDKIVLDPGIGFGKPVEGNYELIVRLAEFSPLGCPLLVGPSRKSFLKAAGQQDPSQRLEGTLAAVTVAVLAGARLLRVHDVGPAARAAAAAHVFARNRGAL